MRYIYLSFLALLLTISCQRFNHEIIIKGTIPLLANEKIELKSRDFQLYTKTDAKGYFEITFEANASGFYTVDLNKEYLIYLEPNWETELSVNSDGELVINGDGVNEYQFYCDYKRYRKSILNKFDSKKLFSMPKDNFIASLSAIRDKLNEVLPKPENETSLSRNYLKLEYERNRYWWADMMNTYPMMFNAYKGFNNPEIDSSFIAFLSDFDLNNHNLLQLHEYEDFVKSYVNLISYVDINISKKYENVEFKETHARLNGIIRAFTNKEVLNYVLAYNVNRQINRLEVNDELMSLFENHCKNDSIKSEMRDTYSQLRKLQKGNIAPDFVMCDRNGKEYRLSDFKGKYVYIDVWSTRCNPCIAEFPYLNEIEQDFKDSNIEFIGVCLDDAQARWLNILDKKKPAGIQLSAQSDFSKNYMIWTVPCYILIDKEGRFLSARTLRPSGNLRSLLKEIVEI